MKKSVSSSIVSMLFVITIILLLLSFYDTYNMVKPLSIQDGQVTLYKPLDNKILYELNGEWNLYELDERTFNLENKSTVGLITVPSNLLDTYPFLGNTSFVEYESTVYLNLDSPQYLGLYTHNIRTEYRILINDEIIYASGDQLSLENAYKPANMPATLFFFVEKPVLNLKIQVFNNIREGPGIILPIYFGTAFLIERYSKIVYNWNFFYFLILIILSVLSLLMYLIFLRIKAHNYRYLIFSLMSFSLAIVNGSLSARIFFQLMSNIPSYLLIRLSDSLEIVFISLSMIQIYLVNKTFFTQSIWKLFAVLLSIHFILSLSLNHELWLWLMQFTLPSYYLGHLYAMYRLHKTQLEITNRRYFYYIVFILVFPLFYGISAYLYNHGIEWISAISNEMIIVYSLYVFGSITVDQLELVKLNYDLEHTQLKQEIALLQYQIKPHFLFNTLTSIHALIESKPKLASSLILQLSRFLRNSFDFDYTQDTVSLQHEVDLVKAYVAIESERFKNRLSIQMNVDTSLLNQEILSLSIQPLVENGIKHGLIQYNLTSLVLIDVSKQKGRIHVLVSSDGMLDEKINVIDFLKKSTKGVGLKNIHQRLYHLTQEGLGIKLNPRGGIDVEFFFPIKEKT